ncbi:MAG TPA: hypothetical protein VEP30_07880 [Chthoniobacterales bacterium]|nr:hypothetical protein [Chthoniobacterales bacterium]
MRNVLITGTPRSGTTLVCSLLNKLPDVVALHEPMNVWEFAECRDGGDEIVKMIEDFCAESRKSLHEHKFAISKHVGGKVRDNSAAVDRGGKRTRQTEHGRIEIGKPLSKDFTLAIKHPAAFTALIETLSKHFECFAIIRNPLATIASWNSLDWFPLKDGHLPIGEKLDVDLARELAAKSDPIERQIHILEWFYDRFRRFLPEGALIKYEDLIASRGRELAKFFPAAAELDEDLSSKNLNKYYDRALMMDLGRRLLGRDGPIWNFYSKRDVESLFNEVASTVPAQR